MSPWPVVSVTEIAAQTRNALVGGPFGSNLVSADYVPTGVPVIRGQNMGGRWVGGEFAFVSVGKAEALSSNIARPGDLIFTQRGTLGQVALVPSGPYDKYVISQSQMKLTINPEIACPVFYYYLFSSEDQQAYVFNNAIQTGVPHTNLGILRKTPVPLPPLPVQQEISQLLSSLDDKIELNRRMNETLEGMAQAIFRDWFVDFGPTRRKAAGEADPVAIMGGLTPDPARAAQLAVLFPAAFGDDGLPEGWTEAEFGAEFDLTMGQSPPGDTYNDTGDGLPFFQGRTDFGFRYPENRKFCSAPSRIANADDTLISVRAPVGDLNMAWERCCIGRGVACARHKSGSASYTFYTLRSLQPELELYEHTGTVFGAINRKQFEKLPVVKSTVALVDAFEAIAGPMDEKLKLATQENRTLAETRDYLLPRLMSGAVRVAPKVEAA